MTEGPSLILNERPVPRGEASELKLTSPYFAYVCQTESGVWELETARPQTWKQRFLTRNRPCYAVDLSDHRRTGELGRTPLPCSDQAHRFEAGLEVGFRVHDPVEVVRRNVRDPLSVVYGALVGQLRAHARRFAIDEAARAEAYINQALGQGLVLDSGITVFHCAVRLEPDQAARAYIEQLTQDRRATTTGGNAAAAEIRRTEHQERLEDIRQRARLERERRQRAELSATPLDFRELVREHLVRHPEDTAGATQLLLAYEASATQRADIQEQRQTELLKFFVDKDIVRVGDVNALRDGMVGQITGSTPQPPELGTPGGAPVMWGGSSGGGAHGHAPPECGAIPVYVLVDTSQAAAGCVDQLNDGLRSLHTALGNSPDLARAVRLSVLAFSDTVRVCLPMCQVGWGTDVPTLTAGGPARYAAAFRALADRLPRDVDELKAAVTPVHRPVAFLVTPGFPDDTWTDEHAALLAQPYRPTLVTCALESAGAGLAARVATRPRLSFAPETETAAATTAALVSVLLQDKVLDLGRGVLRGTPDLTTDCPRGLRAGDERR